MYNIDDVNQITADYNRLVGMRLAYENSLKAEQLSTRSKMEQQKLFDQSSVFLSKVSESAQEGVSSYIEEIVTAALCHVFGVGWSFKLKWDTVAKSPAIEFLVESPYEDASITDDPNDSRGGGVRNIIAFAMWLAILGLAGGMKGIILMDEPFSWVSSSNIPALIGFVKLIKEQMNIQILMVTSHTNTAFKDLADNVLHVSKSNGASIVEAV